MKAVILAAGKGIRMLPLTENIPKVLVPIAGKPFLWYLLKNLQKAGINEIGLVVRFKQEKVRKLVREMGIENATFIDQHEHLGTGHAVLQARQFVGNEKFLVINGDNLFSVGDIQQIASKPGNFLSGFEVDDASAYGALVIDEGKLVRIEEKSKTPSSNLVNTGLYLFGPEIFEKLSLLSKSERGEYELPDAMTALAKEGRMSVYKLKDYWIDLGKKEDVPIVEAQIKQLNFL